jgi:hypothetical protein
LKFHRWQAKLARKQVRTAEGGRKPFLYVGELLPRLSRGGRDRVRARHEVSSEGPPHLLPPPQSHPLRCGCHQNIDGYRIPMLLVELCVCVCVCVWRERAGSSVGPINKVVFLFAYERSAHCPASRHGSRPSECVPWRVCYNIYSTANLHKTFTLLEESEADIEFHPLKERTPYEQCLTPSTRCMRYLAYKLLTCFKYI